MKLQSQKMFKTTKDMFYKQFDFFANWQGRLWGFVNLVLSNNKTDDLPPQMTIMLKTVIP